MVGLGREPRVGDEPQALSFSVAGRVVGTDLCPEIRRWCTAAGLVGWCQEFYDTVEGTVQGRPRVIEGFRAWLAQGVPGCRVDLVDWRPAAVHPDRETFRWVIAPRKD